MHAISYFLIPLDLALKIFHGEENFQVITGPTRKTIKQIKKKTPAIFSQNVTQPFSFCLGFLKKIYQVITGKLLPAEYPSIYPHSFKNKNNEKIKNIYNHVLLDVPNSRISNFRIFILGKLE